VDIGAELFAMAAVCVRAQRDARRNAGDSSALELAGVFCRMARSRVEALFEDIRKNADPEVYAAARGVLDGRYAWLEQGIVEAPEAAEAPLAEAKGAAGA
jgi:hypothetical protein